MEREDRVRRAALKSGRWLVGHGRAASGCPSAPGGDSVSVDRDSLNAMRRLACGAGPAPGGRPVTRAGSSEQSQCGRSVTLERLPSTGTCRRSCRLGSAAHGAAMPGSPVPGRGRGNDGACTSRGRDRTRRSARCCCLSVRAGPARRTRWGEATSRMARSVISRATVDGAPGSSERRSASSRKTMDMPSSTLTPAGHLRASSLPPQPATAGAARSVLNRAAACPHCGT